MIVTGFVRCRTDFLRENNKKSHDPRDQLMHQIMTAGEGI
jgi:hypothetical protein